MPVRTFLAVLAALGLAIPSLVRAQTASPGPSLRVTGKVGKSLVLHEADLAKLPHQHLAVTDEKGHPASYDGVPVSDILRLAGVPLGKLLRGPQMKLYVVVNAADGYSVVFALAELDPGFNERAAVLADQRDLHPIAAPEGPLRLVVPSDRRHARWVREVTELDVEEAK